MTDTLAQNQVAVAIPGYVAGEWDIDPVHSEVGFSVRHMMVSKVRGRFGKVEGRIVTGENPLDSKVWASIEVDSIDTNTPDRDAHLRSADFFDAVQFPTIRFQSTRIRQLGEGFELDGDLTIHGVTRLVTLALEVNGFTKDPYGGTRSGFSASGEISRKEYGMEFNIAMDGGGVVVGDKITINLEVEAVLKDPAAEGAK